MLKKITFFLVLMLTFSNRTDANIIKVPEDFALIQDAVINAQNGDTILVASGEFWEIIQINKELTLIGSEADSTVIINYQISPDDSTKPTLLIFSNNVSIKNIFVITPTLTARDGPNAIHIVNSSNISLKQMTVYGGNGHGADFGQSGGNGIEIVKSFHINIDSSFIYGGNGDNGHFLTIAGDGGQGIQTMNSQQIFINNSVIQGGIGDKAPFGLEDWQGTGGDGIRALQYSKLDVLNSTLIAGKGQKRDGFPLFCDSTSTIDTTNVKIVTKIIDAHFNLPVKISLDQNYPNPFNLSTTISYSIPRPGFVSLKVYDIIGREVKTLVCESKEANHYKVSFNADNLTSGIYYYRLQVGENLIATKKMLIIK